MSDIKSIVEKSLEYAKKYGAQNARIKLLQDQSIDMSWRKNKLENLNSSGESTLVLTLYVDEKYGHYNTSDLRPENIDTFIKKCIDMTRLLEVDPARVLPDPDRYANRADIDLQLFDPAAEAFTPNDMMNRCRELEELTLAHSELPILDVTTYYSLYQGQSFAASTNGFTGETKSSFFASTTILVLTDGDKKPSDYGSSFSHHLADLRTPQAVVDQAAQFCALKIGQKKLPSANRTLIFDRRVASQMVQNFIKPIFGNSLVMKSSYFQDKIGHKFASNLFDLKDDPLLVRGINARLFDTEGMASTPRSLFSKGTLETYLLDTYSAKKLNLEPTTGMHSDLVLTPGSRSLDAMIADVKDGIYVTDLLGGNQDNVRGDFSHGIAGVAIENGKLTTPVSEMNITGNHTDLWQRLSEVGNDIRNDTNHRIPSIRIDDVAVSGS